MKVKKQPQLTDPINKVCHLSLDLREEALREARSGIILIYQKAVVAAKRRNFPLKTASAYVHHAGLRRSKSSSGRLKMQLRFLRAC